MRRSWQKIIPSILRDEDAQQEAEYERSRIGTQVQDYEEYYHQCLKTIPQEYDFAELNNEQVGYINQNKILDPTNRDIPEQAEHQQEELTSNASAHGQEEYEENLNESPEMLHKCTCTIDCAYHLGVLLGEQIRPSIAEFSSKHFIDVTVRINSSNTQ